MKPSIVKAFQALRPNPAVASLVASVPYDVVDYQEAKQLVEGRPLSFLRVGRSEVTMDESTDPYSQEVYEKARQNLEKLEADGHLVRENAASLYLYRLTWKGRSQYGVVGAYSVQAYRDSRIKKHEKTRRAKEDDRTNHILTTRAQTGPVFLVHRPTDEINALRESLLASQDAPLFDFEAEDGVSHTIWVIANPEPWEQALNDSGDFYIADGHHRAASAERTATHLKATESDAASRFLAVAFPTDQVAILPYHRVLSQLNGHSLEEVVAQAQQRFQAQPLDLQGQDLPAEPPKGTVYMYTELGWHQLRLPQPQANVGVADNLDAAVLQREFLQPVLGIEDVRTDSRIDFVGGIRGLGELKRRVDGGGDVIAFAMAATTLQELLDVSDADEIMPPKSTWFEPKLRDGLLIHSI